MVYFNIEIKFKIFITTISTLTILESLWYNVSGDIMERVIAVGINFNDNIEESMYELEKLVEAQDAKVIFKIVQSKEVLNAALYIGKGKADEIKILAEENNIDMIVFNDELSGVQTRNLEDRIGVKIVDRTNLILDIFATRAKTIESKLQVKLAQLSYRLPRLQGMNNHLSREGGGIGTRGPGEQKLETDRRHIEREISYIKNRLKELEKVGDMKGKKRENTDLPYVSLVGYTNAGKSTILNSILDFSQESDKKVFEKDMLFATLEPSVRRAVFPSGAKFIISDTVGFVSKLPTKLVEAFKSTLKEFEYADVILHVLDASDKNMELQMKTTRELIKDMNISEKKILRVYNKMDKTDITKVSNIDDRSDKSIYMSAKEPKDIIRLLNFIEEEIKKDKVLNKILIPYDESHIVNEIKSRQDMKLIEYTEKGALYELMLTEADMRKYKEYIKDDDAV